MLPSKYEYHDSGAHAGADVYGVKWGGMTFAPQIAHNITATLFLVRRVGVGIGVVTVGIRVVDPILGPTGPDLTLVTFDASDITTNPGGEWMLALLPARRLNAAVYPAGYVIILSYPTGDATHKILWTYSRIKDGFDYPRGMATASGDGGVNWTAHPEADFLFEEWGVLGGAHHHPTHPTEPNRGKALSRMGSL